MGSRSQASPRACSRLQGRRRPGQRLLGISTRSGRTDPPSTSLRAVPPSPDRGRRRARRAPADRVSDRPGSALHCRSRPSTARCSSLRRAELSGSACTAAAGAEPDSSCPSRARPEPLKVVGAVPMLSLRRLVRAPIFTRFLGAPCRESDRHSESSAWRWQPRRAALGQRDRPDAACRAAPERGRRPHAPRHDAPAARRPRAQLAARVGGSRLIPNSVEVRSAPEGPRPRSRPAAGRAAGSPTGLAPRRRSTPTRSCSRRRPTRRRCSPPT